MMCTSEAERVGRRMTVVAPSWPMRGGCQRSINRKRVGGGRREWKEAIRVGDRRENHQHRE